MWTLECDGDLFQRQFARITALHSTHNVFRQKNMAEAWSPILVWTDKS